MTEEEVISILNGVYLNDKNTPGTIMYLAHTLRSELNCDLSLAPKELIVSKLAEYYCQPGRFQELWKRLVQVEREVVALYIWSKGLIPALFLDELVRKYELCDIRMASNYYYAENLFERFKSKYVPSGSSLWLIAPKNNLLFENEIKAVIGEMERSYTEVKGEFTLVSRQNRNTDFHNIVNFFNSNKASTYKSGLLNKTSAVKLFKYCGYEEYSTYVGENPECTSFCSNLMITYPLLNLMLIGGLLTVANSAYVPSAKAFDLLKKPYVDLVKHLFNSYISTKSYDEIALISGLKTIRGHQPFRARQNLLEEIKLCPPGQLVYTEEFTRYLHLNNPTFARGEIRFVRSSYFKSDINWELYEERLIEIILSFLHVLGLVDVVWGEKSFGYTNGKYRVPQAFRLNSLGAYILGLTDSFVLPDGPEINFKGGFTVLPDYTVLVPSGLERLKHEKFFDSLLTKLTSTEEAVIYKIDFPTIARLIGSGTSISDLLKYLNCSDKPLPLNVIRSFEDFKQQIGRIRFRQVTVLEFDDEVLLEEVIRYKGIKDFVHEKLGPAVVVDGSAKDKIKKIIEKNKRFCSDVF
jgi:hypothetical protein